MANNSNNKCENLKQQQKFGLAADTELELGTLEIQTKLHSSIRFIIIIIGIARAFALIGAQSLN